MVQDNYEYVLCIFLATQVSLKLLKLYLNSHLLYIYYTIPKVNIHSNRWPCSLFRLEEQGCPHKQGCVSSQHLVQGEGEGLGAADEWGTCCSWTCSSSLLEGKGRCALVSSRYRAVNRLECKHTL